MRYSSLFEKTEQFYHGSTAPISKFSLEYQSKDGGRKLEGPGIYFTSSEDGAGVYGNYIHSVSLDIQKSKLCPVTKRFSAMDVQKLIEAAPGVEDTLTDWGDTYGKGLKAAVSGIMDIYGPNQYREMVTQVWADFYRDHDVAWIQEMVKLGYDGFMITRSNGDVHFICYNLSIIKRLEVAELA